MLDSRGQGLSRAMSDGCITQSVTRVSRGDFRLRKCQMEKVFCLKNFERRVRSARPRCRTSGPLAHV
jgi:hypothetical protein